MQLDRRGHRVYRAGEFHQHAVTQKFDDAAAVLAHSRLQDQGPTLFKRGKRAHLIGLHQPRISDYIRNEDGGQSAKHTFFGHLCRPPAAHLQTIDLSIKRTSA
ncbi:hypothetical protein NKH92_03955 [Mesorhizobium sp. M0871]|uniref:hypothetical protein n=1 Tax=Mesorhizobium sp. M0871 TaxID=2957017 RepID=UPI003338694F